MAYNAAGLGALSYSNGFTLWHYRSTDLIAEVDNAGYFNQATKMLRVGDFVFVHAGVGSTPTFGLVVVAANQNGEVDVSNVTAFGGINAD